MNTEYNGQNAEALPTPSRSHHADRSRATLPTRQFRPIPDSVLRRADEFMALVAVGAADACWPWLGTKTPKGYGNFARFRAHRIAYRLAKGPIPDEMALDHLCRNPSCVNPSHLEAVTDRENTLRGDGPSAMAARSTHCKNGHEYTQDSSRTRIRRDTGREYRDCLICKRQWFHGKSAEFVAERRAKRNATAAEKRRQRRALLDAAPGLLAALKAIRLRIHFIGMPQEARTEDGRPDWRKQIAQMEAAIAKAEGR